MQPFNLLRHLKKDFVDYLSSKYPFAERGMDKQDKQLRDIMSEPGVLFQDPVVQIVRGRKTNNVAIDSMFHPALARNMQAFKQPYEHQRKSWHNIQNNIPTVIATGTGSGKSEGFIFPIIDGLLKQNFHKSGNRIGALLLYPMNALVEDQFFRILKYTKGTDITAGIYNGTFKNPSRSFRERINKKIQGEINPDISPDSVYVDPDKPETVPHILLTNYKMLEYMLLRSSDQTLFKGIDLQYLVLDEAHIYTGTLGLEIACLLARLRVHLDAGGKNFLPIATSATLVQKSPQSDEDSNGKQDNKMRDFFTQLFGKYFPDNNNWLLEDEYEKLEDYQQETFAKFLQVRSADIDAELEKSFPDSLLGLAKLFFAINLEDTLPKGSQEAYEQWGKLIFPRVEQMARALPKILLDDDRATVIKWQDAIEKFHRVLQGSASHLEALLILASHAFKENFKFPTLGLRVHVFTKPEPRIYWSLDKQRLARQPQGDTLDFVSCRNCGHQAWAALYEPINEGGGTSGRLLPLPDFYEEHDYDSGQEFVVFHNINDIDETNFDKKNWEKETWQLNEYGNTGLVAELSNKNTEYIRIKRTDSKNNQAGDNHSCPACGSTSSEKRRAMLSTMRSSAATDIGIYGASLLTNMDLPHERRLLAFCDNRQETSFLASFLTDRHRRLNVKRAIATFLKEKPEQHWQLFNIDKASSSH